MYAVFGQVRVDTAREADAQKLLEEFVVPATKSLPGFKGGHWARAVDGDAGHSMLLFDSEEHARGGAARIEEGPPPGAPVSFVGVTVCEIVAQA